MFQREKLQKAVERIEQFSVGRDDETQELFGYVASCVRTAMGISNRKRTAAVAFGEKEAHGDALSQHSLAQAAMAKADVSAIGQAESGIDEEVAPESSNFIPYSSIANKADREYLNWRAVHADVKQSNTFTDSLREWLTGISVEDLAKIIDSTPRGLVADETAGAAFDFTPWQRISMAFYTKPFFAVTASVGVSSENLYKLARYDGRGCARRLPIESKMSTLGGFMRDFGIIDLPTAAGKTAWVLSVILMHLSGSDNTDFASKCNSERIGKFAGGMFSGPSDCNVARMAVVVASASTNGHFVKSLTRLIPRFAEVNPSMRVVVWDNYTGSGKKSTQIAREMPPNVIVVWVVCPSKVNQVLREHPDVTVPMVVYDEYTHETPREKCPINRSQVMKRIILQATPQALVKASSGNSSDLQTVFNGSIQSPSLIHQYISHRNFASATLAVQQLCKLHLMTVTPFRTLVRKDLKRLVPLGIATTNIESQRVSMASHISESHADIVPASLKNVVLNYLGPFKLTDESRAAVNNIFADESITPGDMVTLFENLESTDVRMERTRVDRLKERVCEFRKSCPVCFGDESETNGMRILGCCGYCMCTRCYRENRRSVCPFCRTEIRTTFTCSEVETPEETKARKDRLSHELYPTKPSGPFFSPDDMRRNTQLANMCYTLHHALDIGCTRILLVIEKPTASLDFEDFIDVNCLSLRTGIRIMRVDNAMQGSGKRFIKIKNEFDSVRAEPICMLSYGIDEKFLVGTDLARADCLVAVGSIRKSLMTQAMGRIMRPCQDRDNTRNIPVFRVFSRA